MRHIRRACALWLAVLAAVLACVPADGQTPASQTTVLRAARMLDPQSGEVIRNAVVIVEGDAIMAAGANLTAPAGAKVIDLGNMILLPGLIDCHTHLLENYQPGIGGDSPNMIVTVATMSPARRVLLGAKMGREDLEAGITSVREVGNSGWNGDVALRDAIEDGWVVGPRIFASTRALADAGGQFFGGLAPYAQNLVEQEYAVINGSEDARRAVRQAAFDGADLIKVIVNTPPRVLTLEEMKAIVDEAQRMGMRVAAHATNPIATRTAAEAGVNSIEHGYRIEDDALKLMASKNIDLVPTDYPADFYVSGLGGTAMTPEERQRRLASVQQSVARSRERVQRAIRLGVKIAFGSDEYYDISGQTRGQSSLLTLQAYQEDGMSPLEVIRTATINAADLLGESDRLGTMELGKFADIIAVAGDPLRDVKELQRVRFVMKGGQVIRNDGAEAR
ncbi:MAG: amidohydrolase family protein [Gemmatimonadaceae bacterium]